MRSFDTLHIDHCKCKHISLFALGSSRMNECSPIAIRYVEPVFRPPSEAHSLILPVTDGCSWNQCRFCEMYTAPQKKFRARDEAEVFGSIRWAAQALGERVRRVFLADGDALVLPTHRLLAILAAIGEQLPAVQRVSSYCLPRNLRRKSVAELATLQAAGLKLVYVGAESGDDTVLDRVGKGETCESTREALDKLAAAGIRRSVMILNGLGGSVFSRQHAEQSAWLVNATQPEYLATLVVSFPQGEARFRAGFPEWQPLDQHGLFREMEQFITALELQRTIFRSDHASNWLMLKGTLGKDKARLLAEVRRAIADPARAALRPEWARGL
jgi:radical SAM superfamily enzyme YgiQ (UPF0313 family)